MINMTEPPDCPYCGKPSKLVGGDEVYPNRSDLHDKMFYQCAPCDARVGCHPESVKPLGRLANAALRSAKMEAHRSFDRLWKGDGKSRSSAYAWLAIQLGIKPENCHIGMFDEVLCDKVIEVSKTAERFQFSWSTLKAKNENLLG